jgi:single-strand DNA-binding protein
MNINRILLSGNLTADPELLQAGKSKVVNARLANNQFFTDGGEERQQITTFVDLKVWGTAAENFSKFARQGQEIFIEGELRQDRWERRPGQQALKNVRESVLLAVHATSKRRACRAEWQEEIKGLPPAAELTSREMYFPTSFR